MSDTRGEFWHFHATDLRPGRPLSLSLTDATADARFASRGSLRPFRSPTSGRNNSAILFFSCAGGHEAHEVLAACRSQPAAPARAELPAACSRRQWRSRLLGPAVAAHLQALRRVGGGRNDRRQVRPRWRCVRRRQRDRAQARGRPADRPDLWRRTSARRRCSSSRTITTISTTTKPPTTSSRSRRSHFMLQLARATQQMYYPEFLPDVARPRGLALVVRRRSGRGVSESFGTLRYGRLAEVLLYDIRRTMTLAGPSAVYRRSRSREMAEGADGGDRRHPCRSCAVQPARLDAPANGASGIRTFSAPTAN